MWEHARLPFRLLMINKPMQAFRVSHPELAHLLDAPTAGAAGEAIRRMVEERGPEDNSPAVVVWALDESAAAAPPLDRTLFMGPAHSDPPHRRGRSALGAVATLLALLALAAAGYAYWTARQASVATRAAVAPATVDSLRSQIDSLRTRVGRIDQPFGPSAGDSVPAVSPPAPDSVRGAPR
jgi:hypothetical protein